MRLAGVVLLPPLQKVRWGRAETSIAGHDRRLTFGGCMPNLCR